MTCALDQVSDELLAHGFKYAPVLDSYPVMPAFIRVFASSLGEFTVHLPISDPSLLKLPKPKLLSLPDELAGVRLPHLEGNQTICLFDEATKNIDPLNPRALIAACIEQLEQIIEGWAKGTSRLDIAAEFTSYWCFHKACYLYSSGSDSKLYSFDRKQLDESIATEYLIAGSVSEALSWALKRGFYPRGSIVNPSELCPVIRVSVKQPFYIPFDADWPLTTLGSFLAWLRLVDHNATANLVDKLRKEAKNRSHFFILLSHETTYIGLQLTLERAGKVALGVNLPKRKKLNLRQTFSTLTKHHCLSKFTRFLVEDATKEYIYQRNTTTFKGLQDMRICVIGCGTVGGYLSQSLVQSGAGVGRGVLCFYDADILRTGNLGRHILGTIYLDEKKSDAMAHYFQQQGLAPNSRAAGEFTRTEIDKPWDLIVDATGEQGFSLMLTKWYHERNVATSRPNIIHSWVSGFGHQAKALIYTGEGACYACQFNYNSSPRTDRYQSFSTKHAQGASQLFKRTCGESHLPFGPEASMIAAALAMRLLKQEQEGEVNFLQKAISPKARQYPEKNMSPMKNCPICQN
ncbi:ThiF family adenylyltransferase [Psychrobium sp. 1_MG-2023]|uniref:ThiF family adenylyltransferase n=1 Tax=Psychrobium sp. 1_MG-2023 TaxID=3062624 RepID=UPI002732771C|nr:ThiF family adenylyltransferase [Psychrobium sp. 1_MG-2023]MDP2560766.1 ThiF family adenylyltransferase [Psychrobium sp. 1_MG-2023]